MAKNRKKKVAENVVARNKEARRRWDVEETFEAGLVLLGTEIKAIREGKVQLADAYAQPKGNELYLVNMHIGAYKAAGPHAQHDPLRPRKLLLKRDQIEELLGHVTRRGYSLIPLDVHLTHGYAKVELGLCRGKKQADRREEIKRRESTREMERAIRDRSR